MGKYLLIWEADESKIPINPEERRIGWLGAIEMTRQEMREGLTKDWGVFIGQTKGYSIVEGTEDEVINNTLKYIPFFKFTVYPLGSLD